MDDTQDSLTSQQAVGAATPLQCVKSQKHCAPLSRSATTGVDGMNADLTHADNARSQHPVLLPSIHVLLQLIGSFALCQRHVAAIPPLHLLLHLCFLLGKQSLITQEWVVSFIHLGAPLFLVIPLPV